MWEIYHYFVIKNMNSHECTEDHHHFFVITLILVSIPVQSLSALMAYHLTCQHVKFSSSLFFFLSSIFCAEHFSMLSLSIQHENFHDHYVCHEVVHPDIFIVITHAWRHVGAILWFSDLVTWLIISSKRNIFFQ